MDARRVAQSLLAIVVCLVIAAHLGALYLAPAVLVTLGAMSTGTYVLFAIGIGLAWPVVALAFALYVTRPSKLRAAQATHDRTRHAAAATEPHRSRIEDP